MKWIYANGVTYTRCKHRYKTNRERVTLRSLDSSNFSIILQKNPLNLKEKKLTTKGGEKKYQKKFVFVKIVSNFVLDNAI